jgi:hypothetical protein
MPRISVPQQRKGVLVRMTPADTRGARRESNEPRPAPLSAMKAPASERWAFYAVRRSGSAAGGQLVYDKAGMAIGFQDADGNLLGTGDPRLPPAVSEILEAAQRKQPANAFELWQQQNPAGSAEEYLKLAGEGRIRPLEQQLLDAEQDGDTDTVNAIRGVMLRSRTQAWSS